MIWPRGTPAVATILFSLMAMVSSSEACALSTDPFNATVSCGCRGVDMLCRGSAIGSVIHDGSNAGVLVPETQWGAFALREVGTWMIWSPDVFSEVCRDERLVARDSHPTEVTNCWLRLMAMGMYDWKPRRWRPLHVQRSKICVTATDVMSLVGKGLGLVVVARLLVLLVRVKTLTEVAVTLMAVCAGIVTFVASIAAAFVAGVGLSLLARNVHFALPVCAVLSLAYWCSALWIGWSTSPIVGVALVAVAVARRRTVLLFPKAESGAAGLLVVVLSARLGACTCDA